MWLSYIFTAEWSHWLFCEAYIEGQDWWLEEELEGPLWKSGWEKRTWAMQPAVETHPYKEMSSIPDQFRRGEKERKSEVIFKFPIWTARWMAVLFTDGKHRRSWLQESEWWGQCCEAELSVSLRYSGAAQCYEVYQAGAWVGSLSWRKRWGSHLHKKCNWSHNRGKCCLGNLKQWFLNFIRLWNPSLISPRLMHRSTYWLCCNRGEQARAYFLPCFYMSSVPSSHQ